MIEWSWIVSPATLFSMAMAGIGFGGWLFTQGGKRKEIEQMRDDLTDLKKTRNIDRENDKKNLDVTFGAFEASIRLLREQLGDYRTHAADTFATKQEMIALEQRTIRGMDQILERVNSIGTRQEGIGEMIMKAVAKRDN